MGIRSGTVSFDERADIRHSVQGTAESVFEAALALSGFAQGDATPGPAAHLEIGAQIPVARHSVKVERVRDWLTSGGKSPSEQAFNFGLWGGRTEAGVRESTKPACLAVHYQKA
jgi:hypothetical protein